MSLDTTTGAALLLLDEAERIVGAAHVRRPGDDGFAERYGDPYTFADGFATAAAGAVLPASVDEVQRIVRAAGRVGASLWTVSRGRNLGYGGAAPHDPSSVVLDLGRMNAVRAVDPDLCYAVVEPGVSFFQLHEHLRAMDAPLWTSVPDLGHGSVLGNALERGFGYTAYGEHGQFLCGMEVVLPDGEIVRTGMAAVTDSSTAHLYKGGFGPSLDGLFQQSNLGVVTSVGVWLMPRPQTAAACLLHVPGPGQLAELVDTVRPLMLDGTIDSVAIVGNALAIASQLMPRAAVSDDPAPLSDERIAQVAERIGIGWWNAKFGLYGAQEVVEAKLEVVRRAAARIGATVDVRVHPGDVDPAAVHPADRAQLGIPSGDLIRMAAWRGGEPAHTDFSLVAPTTGAEAQRLVELVAPVVRDAGFDHAGGFTMFGRHAVMLTLLAFDRSDADERRRIDDLFERLIAVSAAAGFVPYRSHLRFMDRIAGLYDFNDGAARRLVTRIKRTLDPGDVLSPGKQGIRAAPDPAG
ncbi:FAD-binding oxidoreductase [uncultured Amnibacterium sp.]|uniref:FAD-binding oxidoreductase n=1 Tax=uncultured Amnibacterium sp. TaxID=1631851 RepID=UPI0035CAB23A